MFYQIRADVTHLSSFQFRLLQFMIEEGVSLELKVESAVVLGSIAKGTEDNIRSLIDAGAISVLFKGTC